jgi:NADPH-dependent 2,4-dienoyl-CoA reductase/sulfur reductase-like enzyme
MKYQTNILIVGGGPAGMAAAYTSSQSGTDVLVVDDNPKLGGQIWRNENVKPSTKEASEWFEKIRNAKFDLQSGTRIVSNIDEKVLLAETPDGFCEVEFSKLILTTGARERFLPFEGWTLPNVMGAGGLQALVKNGLPIEGKRVVIAGTGPLLLAVAAYLKKRGANVLLIAEQTGRKKLFKFALNLIKQPSKISQALQIRKEIKSVPYKTNCYPIEANGREKLSSVAFQKGRKKFSIECDYLACGFHLLPNVELALLLGCETKNNYVVVDEWQQTSVKDVFCAGETTGIGGVELSLIEGQIAGYTATDEKEKAESFFAEREKQKRFADLLNQTFELREELKSLSSPDTIVCRCEDVTFSRLAHCNSWREAKLHTRCGMGACQGRICGGAVDFLFGWSNESIRPPIMPVRLELLTHTTNHETKTTNYAN